MSNGTLEGTGGDAATRQLTDCPTGTTRHYGFTYAGTTGQIGLALRLTAHNSPGYPFLDMGIMTQKNPDGTYTVGIPFGEYTGGPWHTQANRPSRIEWSITPAGHWTVTVDSAVVYDDDFWTLHDPDFVAVYLTDNESAMSNLEVAADSVPTNCMVTGFTQYADGPLGSPWTPYIDPNTELEYEFPVVSNGILEGTGGDAATRQLTDCPAGTRNYGYTYAGTGGQIELALRLTAHNSPGYDFLDMGIITQKNPDGTYTVGVPFGEYIGGPWHTQANRPSRIEWSITPAGHWTVTVDSAVVYDDDFWTLHDPDFIGVYVPDNESAMSDLLVTVE